MSFQNFLYFIKHKRTGRFLTQSGSKKWWLLSGIKDKEKDAVLKRLIFVKSAPKGYVTLFGAENALQHLSHYFPGEFEIEKKIIQSYREC